MDIHQANHEEASQWNTFNVKAWNLQITSHYSSAIGGRGGVTAVSLASQIPGKGVSLLSLFVPHIWSFPARRGGGWISTTYLIQDHWEEHTVFSWVYIIYSISSISGWGVYVNCGKEKIRFTAHRHTHMQNTMIYLLFTFFCFFFQTLFLGRIYSLWGLLLYFTL